MTHTTAFYARRKVVGVGSTISITTPPVTVGAVHPHPAQLDARARTEGPPEAVVHLPPGPAETFHDLAGPVVADLPDADVCDIDATARKLGVEQGPARRRSYATGPT
jgi:hypothetical protein